MNITSWFFRVVSWFKRDYSSGLNEVCSNYNAPYDPTAMQYGIKARCWFNDFYSDDNKDHPDRGLCLEMSFPAESTSYAFPGLNSISGISKIAYISQNDGYVSFSKECIRKERSGIVTLEFRCINPNGFARTYAIKDEDTSYLLRADRIAFAENIEVQYQTDKHTMELCFRPWSSERRYLNHKQKFILGLIGE